MIPTVSGALLNSDCIRSLYVDKEEKGWAVKAKLNSEDCRYLDFVVAVDDCENKAHTHLAEIGHKINIGKIPLSCLWAEQPQRDADRICACIIEQIKHLRATCTRQGYELPKSIKRRIETIEHLCK